MKPNSMRLAILTAATAVALAALPAVAADHSSTTSATVNAKTSPDGITTVGKLVESQPIGNTPNGPQTMAKPAHEWPLPPAETRQIQQALNRDGAKLAADGVFDQATRKALRDYQSRHGLAVTGQPDLATLTKLKIA